MSIENNLKRIADALEKLVDLTPAVPVAEAPGAPAPAPIPPVTSEAAAAPPVPPTPAPAPASPPVSQNEPQTQLPFADINGLVQYVMQKYQQLGPEKGAGIQGVLTGLGYSNINDVQPNHFADFYNKVEAIK